MTSKPRGRKKPPRSRKRKPETATLEKQYEIVPALNPGLFPLLALSSQFTPPGMRDNPVLLWGAYRAARLYGHPIPQEFLNYLDLAAQEICGKASIKDPDDVVLKALQFRRPHARSKSVFQKGRQFLERFVLAQIIEGEVESFRVKYNNSRGIQHAYNQIAATLGLKPGYVRNIDREFRRVGKVTYRLSGRSILQGFDRSGGG